jgi:hypothetical protein
VCEKWLTFKVKMGGFPPIGASEDINGGDYAR